jgi:hypothetical protein
LRQEPSRKEVGLAIAQEAHPRSRSGEAESHEDAIRWALADPSDPVLTAREKLRISDQAEYALGDRPISDERAGVPTRGR